MEERPQPAQRLDEHKLATLRTWGLGLATEGRDEEIRAAGRAILMLADEVDALQRDLWHSRAHVSDRLPDEQQEPAPDDDPSRSSLAGALARRLRVQRSAP